jgi:hypothetical protein
MNDWAAIMAGDSQADSGPFELRGFKGSRDRFCFVSRMLSLGIIL